MARCSIRTMMKVVAGTAVCLAIIVPVARWIATARNLGLQAQCESNMRNVALGIMGVLTTKGSFPSGTIFNANLLPKDRIGFYASAIPYLDHGGLYELIDQSQSWAGPTNIAVAGTRDYLLQCLRSSVGGRPPRSTRPVSVPSTDSAHVNRKYRWPNSIRGSLAANHFHTLKWSATRYLIRHPDLHYLQGFPAHPVSTTVLPSKVVLPLAQWRLSP
jgi:Protein of unknown function (DUF1559)